MGWVCLYLLLLSLGSGLASPNPQLWEWGRVRTGEGDNWEPDRTPKSLGFLGSREEAEEEVENNSVEDSGELTKEKKAKLNVSDKDSPYALIDKYFPERESYYYQNKNKFVEEYRGQESKTDIGNINPSEVWLADDNLLVLKGGSTIDRTGWDDPWEPLDDFQAPYREPVLPPPDFDPDSLEIGVGVDIETLVAQRELEKELEEQKKQRSHEESLADIPPFLYPDNALKPFKDEVLTSHQEEFQSFINDVSQFISDMENFHSARKVLPDHQQSEELPSISLPPPETFSIPVSRKPSFKSVDDVTFTAPPPSNPPPTTSSPRSAPFTSFSKKQIQDSSPSLARKVHHHHSPSIEVLPKSFRDSPPKSFRDSPPKSSRTTPKPTPNPPKPPISPAWQRHKETEKRGPAYKPPPTTENSSEEIETSPTPYPLSYSSPHSKVFLSTKYVTHAPAPTPSQSPPVSTRARSSSQRLQAPPPEIRDQNRSFSFSFPEDDIPPPTHHPTPVRIFRPRSTTPSTTAAPTKKTTSRTSIPRRQEGYRASHYHHSGEQEDWRPVTPSPRPTRPFSGGLFNPAPTPYSLFQSVPENIGETDVFHLSQNVNFGKKIESGTAGFLTNEVDTGSGRASKPFSPPKYVSTRHPRLISPKARQGPARGGFHPSFKSPKKVAHKNRGRSSVRRRRPKAVPQVPVDRTGTGDVRYVSFYSGGSGGNSWGYSYNLG